MRPEPDALREEIRRFDEKMQRLSDLGIDLHRVSREMLDDLRGRKEVMRRQHEELVATQREADRQLLPALLDLYLHGSGPDRRKLRDLLAEHDSFRWGFGWGLTNRIANADDARRALAVLSMKDGGNDYRDQSVALNGLCTAMRKAGLAIGPLLTEAAAWSSNVAPFPPARSARALLLDYAGRFGT